MLFTLTTDFRELASGKLTYKTEIHEGQHEAIIEPSVFAQVKEAMRQKYFRGGAAAHGYVRSLLQGLIFCGPCGCGMMHTYTRKSGTLYRYYVCVRTEKRLEHLPVEVTPGRRDQQFVVEHIRGVRAQYPSRGRHDRPSPQTNRGCDRKAGI